MAGALLVLSSIAALPGCNGSSNNGGVPFPTATVGATSTPTVGATPRVTPTVRPTVRPTSGGSDCGTQTGSGTATFSAVSAGSTADVSTLTATHTGGTIGNVGGVRRSVTAEIDNGCRSVSVARVVTVSLSSLTGAVEVGRNFSLNGDVTSGAIALVTYTETPVSGGQSEIWTADSGTARVESISGSTVRFRLTNAHFTPAPGSPARGTFTINANGSVNALISNR